MSPVLLKTKDNKYISEIMQNTSHLQVSSKRKLFAPFESFMTNRWTLSTTVGLVPQSPRIIVQYWLAIEPSYDNKD